MLAPVTHLDGKCIESPFEMYIDASEYELIAVVAQNNRLIAFFGRKLNITQGQCSITEKEIQSIVETLNEFEEILLDQHINVYTDHMNLVQDALGLHSNQVWHWRLILEEYRPEIVYIVGITNILVNAISV